MMRSRRAFLTVMLFVFCPLLALAAPPAKEIPFSTRVPLKTGPYYFQFRLWTAARSTDPGGVRVWSEDKLIRVTGVLTGARYSAPLSHVLGSVNPLDNPTAPVYAPVDFSQQLWVEVAYRTALSRPWTVVAGRTRLAAAPYALWSGSSETAGTATDADTVDGRHAAELSAGAHQHSGEDIVGGIVSAGRIDGALTRDAEVLDLVRTGDGPGSGVDADTLDGAHGAGFAGAAQMQVAQNTILALQQSIAALQKGAAGTLTGRVTDAVLHTGIAGAAVTVTPGPLTVYTDAAGAFALVLAPNVYSATFSAPAYADQTREAVVVANGTAHLAVALAPPAGVLVSAGPDITIAPGETRDLLATVSILDGSTLVGYSWRRLADAAEISTALSTSVSAVYPRLADLVDTPSEPFAAPSRHMVMGLTPLGVDRIERSMDRDYEFTVTTSSGSYSDRVKVSAGSGKLCPTSGLRNVARGVPVILGAPAAGTYAWVLQKPEGSAAALDYPAERFVSFTPDFAGTYTVTEGSWSTAITTTDWRGAITGVDGDGRPVFGGDCGVCHDGETASKQSVGHALSFTRGIDGGGPAFGEGCLPCHTVGYDKGAVNDGFDDVAARTGWTLPPPAPGNYATLLGTAPDLAGLGNVQCGNCHGPGMVRRTTPSRSVSYSADVCGVCHGQREGHGRYQQWQGTGHGDLSHTLSRAGVDSPSGAHCARCHSSQGFVAWLSQKDLTKNIQGRTGNATGAEITELGISAGEVQPVTCAACHDPHVDPGAMTVRVTGSTGALPAGFTAAGMGKGAVCAVCHNTRNGVRGDATPPTNFSVPHSSAEVDVLLGKNVYFMATAAPRAPHVGVKDSCVGCHMPEVPSPLALSYADRGKSHTFQASLGACAGCHPGLDGEGAAGLLGAQLSELGTYVGGAAAETIRAAQGNPIEVKVRAWDPVTDEYSSPLAYPPASPESNVMLPAGNPITAAEPVEIHGQMSLRLVLTSPIVVAWPSGSRSSTEVWTQISSIKAGGGAALFMPASNFAKAFWNYQLLAYGGPVHNPTWAQEVIARSLAQVLATAP